MQPSVENNRQRHYYASLKDLATQSRQVEVDPIEKKFGRLVLLAILQYHQKTCQILGHELGRVPNQWSVDFEIITAHQPIRDHNCQQSSNGLQFYCMEKARRWRMPAWCTKETRFEFPHRIEEGHTFPHISAFNELLASEAKSRRFYFGVYLYSVGCFPNPKEWTTLQYMCRICKIGTIILRKDGAGVRVVKLIRDHIHGPNQLEMLTQEDRLERSQAKMNSAKETHKKQNSQRTRGNLQESLETTKCTSIYLSSEDSESETWQIDDTLKVEKILEEDVALLPSIKCPFEGWRIIDKKYGKLDKVLLGKGSLCESEWTGEWWKCSPVRIIATTEEMILNYSESASDLHFNMISQPLSDICPVSSKGYRAGLFTVLHWTGSTEIVGAFIMPYTTYFDLFVLFKAFIQLTNITPRMLSVFASGEERLACYQAANLLRQNSSFTGHMLFRGDGNSSHLMLGKPKQPINTVERFFKAVLTKSKKIQENDDTEEKKESDMSEMLMEEMIESDSAESRD